MFYENERVSGWSGVLLLLSLSPLNIKRLFFYITQSLIELYIVLTGEFFVKSDKFYAYRLVKIGLLSSFVKFFKFLRINPKVCGGAKIESTSKIGIK